MKFYEPRVAVDTSAIVKWFKVEEDRESALKLRSWTEEEKIKLVISAILPSEYARVLKNDFFTKNRVKTALRGVAICFLSNDRQRSESAQAFRNRKN